jgi:molybdenum cofactor cytidylyltransferase
MISCVSAIILAAGESKRMGMPKQLLPLGQDTILGQTIDNFLSSKVSEIIVVVGYRAQEVINSINSRPVKVAVNPIYQHGMGTSISAGLNLISDKVQGIMIALADQPFIGNQTIDRLIGVFSSSNKGIVVPVYNGRRGNPVIFNIQYKQELLALEGDVGGREIIAKHPEDVIEIIFASDDIVNDIDTEDKYNLAKDKITKLDENV